MALAFRNLKVTPADPVETWGVVGIQTALERGTLQDWHRIAMAAKDPESEVAQEFEAAAKISDRPAATWWVRRKLEILRASPEKKVTLKLKRYVIESGLTQSQFAELLGTSGSRLSTYLSGKVAPSAVIMEKSDGIRRRRA